MRKRQRDICSTLISTWYTSYHTAHQGMKRYLSITSNYLSGAEHHMILSKRAQVNSESG